jgi:hypothetical protein
MKKVFIKYNPYQLETEITVDGKRPAENSKLLEKSAKDSRLQEWVEELPELLVDEYNVKEYEILFHGTLPDYEDLTGVIAEAKTKDVIIAKCDHIPAKETSNKEGLIEDVFNEIKQGPFEELRDDQISNAFEHEKSSDFEVCVVATMSAGKSTLINAMLEQELMPSSQEACTAIITRIKDISSDKIPFRAEVYDKEKHLIETHEKLTLTIMKRLNSDKNVSEIKIFGNIPFVKSEDVSLVLIDTPGPNNSRDDHHRKVQSEFLGKSSKTLVLYIITGAFGTTDDDILLNRVSESMRVGGKQSKDRFIFVVNQLDERKKEDGDPNQTLEKIRSYLNNHGVANPNLFPAAALPALDMRMVINGATVDSDIIDRAEYKTKLLNKNKETHHFENYATLPASIRGEIKGQLDETRFAYSGPENKNPEEALIHTGVVSIEAVIRQYVQKYAKSAKIKNIVDTFMHMLEELELEEKLKKELASNLDASVKIGKQITLVREKIDSAKEAIKFKEKVSDAVNKVNSDSEVVVKSIIKKFQDRIIERIDESREKKLNLDEVEYEVERLEKFAKKLEHDFEDDLIELIRTELINTSNALLESYKNKLVSLTKELETNSLIGVTIDPLKLMSGSIMYSEISIKNLVKTEKIKDGEEYIQTRGWFESIFFWPKKEWVTKYKNVKFINGSELAQVFFEPIQQNFFSIGDKAIGYSHQQSEKIAGHFKNEFIRLDDVLKAKLNELEKYATDREKADENIKVSESRLKWLAGIKRKVDSILEI